MSYRANDLNSTLSTPQLPEVAKTGAWGLLQNNLTQYPLILIRSQTAFAAKSIMSVVLHKDVRQYDVKFWSREELRTLPRCFVSALILMAKLEQTPTNSTLCIGYLTTSEK